MPSARRMRFLGFTAVLATLVILYVTTGPRETRASPFYQKTLALIEARRSTWSTSDVPPNIKPEIVPRERVEDGGSGVLSQIANQEAQQQASLQLEGNHETAPEPDVSLKDRLREAEKQAKKSADDKYRALQDWERALGVPPREKSTPREKKPNKDKKKANGVAKEEGSGKGDHAVVSSDEGHGEHGEQGVAGRKITKDGNLQLDTAETASVNVPRHTSAEESRLSNQGPLEDHGDDYSVLTPAAEELAAILAQSPVTIFSKSYCPFSKKAKKVLLQAHTITPAPYVVELDDPKYVKMTAGGGSLASQIQDLLQARTGRRTVPNVLLSGKSIGGGDDMEELWHEGKLRTTLLNGKGVDKVVVNFAPAKMPPPMAQAVHGAGKRPSRR